MTAFIFMAHGLSDIMKKPLIAIPANIADIGAWLVLIREMLMPIITAVTTYMTFAQTGQTTSSESGNSMAMFKWMMPLMFGYFAIISPQSLVIYWVAFNIVNMIVQWFIMKFMVKPR